MLLHRATFVHICLKLPMSIRFLGFSYCTFFSNLSSLLFSTLFVIFNIPILVLLMLPIPKVNELDALLACLFFVLIIVFTPICYKHIYPSFLSFPVNARNLGLNASKFHREKHHTIQSRTKDFHSIY